jgi:hypothetical protein
MIIILEDDFEKSTLINMLQCPEGSDDTETCSGINNHHNCFDCIKYNYNIKITFAKMESK